MKRKLFMLIVIITLLIDQITKLLIKNNMDIYQQIPIIKDFFRLYYIENDGAAFSILQGKLWLFYFFSIVGLVIVYLFYKSSNNKINIIATSLLCAGLLGNFIDRLLYQKVVDFLSFSFGSYDFAIFNIADICITIAVILFILDLIIEKKNKLNKKGVI